jgi:gamma-tubulin complex component 2
LDISLERLCQPTSKISVQKINSLLELVVRTAAISVAHDKYKNKVVVEFSSMSLFEQLRRINSMVGIDMKKHLQNLRSGRSFNIVDSLDSDHDFENCAGVEEGPLLGVKILINRY